MSGLKSASAATSTILMERDFVTREQRPVMPLTVPRIATLGGSDAAAAAGVDPYRSRVMLWAEKTGRIVRPETEAMRWGTLLEPLVKDELRERGYDVEDVGSVNDLSRPWLIGHPDGIVNESPGLALLEVKTASPYAHRDGVPVRYAAQVQTYLHLTGLDRALLATLVGGQRLDVQEIERDDDAIELLLALMEETHGYIVRDEPPPPDGSASARDALAQLYASDGSTVRATVEDEALVRELRARKSQASALAEQVTELENRLKARMGDAETLVSRHDVKLAAWSPVTSTRLDAKRLKLEAPHVHANYAVTSVARRLTLT